MNGIEVESLCKKYEFSLAGQGQKSVLKGLLLREKRTKTAVDAVSFSIRPGEMVGLIGANGSGKTTIMKLLTGILYPTSGRVLVDGHIPSQREEAFQKEISIVLGQKTQLWWDLPAVESLKLNQIIYDVDDVTYQNLVKQMSELLNVGHLMNIPVRRLSLGERMKFELMASMIHRPSFLFLDEPTIGLDILAQKDFHSFVLEYNRKFGSTVILTSHYMHDIEKLCGRSLVLKEGRLIYDGPTQGICEISPDCVLHFQFKDPVNPEPFSSYGKVAKLGDRKISITVHKDRAKQVMREILEKNDPVDLSLQAATLEDCLEEYLRTDRSENEVSGNL